MPVAGIAPATTPGEPPEPPVVVVPSVVVVGLACRGDG